MKFEMSITPGPNDVFDPKVADHLVGTSTSLKMGDMGNMLALILEAEVVDGRLVMMVEPYQYEWLDKQS